MTARMYSHFTFDCGAGPATASSAGDSTGHINGISSCASVAALGLSASPLLIALGLRAPDSGGKPITAGSEDASATTDFVSPTVVWATAGSAGLSAAGGISFGRRA